MKTFIVNSQFSFSMQQGKMFFFMGIIMATVQGNNLLFLYLPT